MDRASPAVASRARPWRHSPHGVGSHPHQRADGRSGYRSNVLPCVSDDRPRKKRGAGRPPTFGPSQLPQQALGQPLFQFRPALSACPVGCHGCHARCVPSADGLLPWSCVAAPGRMRSNRRRATGSRQVCQNSTVAVTVSEYVPTAGAGWPPGTRPNRVIVCEAPLPVPVSVVVPAVPSPHSGPPALVCRNS